MSKIEFNEYQRQAYELISEEGRKDLITNGVLGLAGEAGECCDIVKKYKYQGHDLDKEKLLDELGDVLWYISETASGIGVSLEDVAIYNLNKLHKRYHGHTFNKDDSINRPEYKNEK